MPTDLYTHRRFVWQRAVMDLRHRYAGTGMGFAWHVLHPLALIAVYSIIFGVFLKRVFEDVPVPYPIFLCSGLLPWMAFAECLTRGCNCFRLNAPYLKKLPVPEQVFVAQSAVTATLSLAISFSLLLIISFIFGHQPTWHWLLLPLPLLLLQAAGFGFGLALGTLNSFFPDIGEVVPVVLRIAMWVAPVIFPLSFFVDHGFGPVVALNPATAVLIAVRDLFIHQEIPPLPVWMGMIGWVVGAWVLGMFVLRMLRSEIRDVL